MKTLTSIPGLAGDDKAATDASTLSAGGVATASVTLVKYHPNEVTATGPASWEQVAYYANLAAKFQHACVAAQVMEGFALLKLRKASQVRAGRPAKLPHDVVIKSWSELVAECAGISDETARRWMAMAEGIKARWKKLAPQARLRALMSVPPTQWTDADTKLIEDSLHKVSDGATQLEFMRELGLAKKPQGAGATGGLGSVAGKKIGIAEQAALLKEQATSQWKAIEKMLSAYQDKFTLLPDADVTAQQATLEAALTARKAWLKQPAAKRDVKPIQEMFTAK